MSTYAIVFKDDELYHYGILGQKWGIRRYQNEDGTLTEAGKKRYEKELAKNAKRKEGKKLSDEEVADPYRWVRNDRKKAAVGTAVLYAARFAAPMVVKYLDSTGILSTGAQAIQNLFNGDTGEAIANAPVSSVPQAVQNLFNGDTGEAIANAPVSSVPHINIHGHDISSQNPLLRLYASPDARRNLSNRDYGHLGNMMLAREERVAAMRSNADAIRNAVQNASSHHAVSHIVSVDPSPALDSAHAAKEAARAAKEAIAASRRRH